MITDCVEQINEEEQALQEIGVGIKDKELLIQVGLMIAKQIQD